jgi:hypothetical protein
MHLPVSAGSPPTVVRVKVESVAAHQSRSWWVESGFTRDRE